NGGALAALTPPRRSEAPADPPPAGALTAAAKSHLGGFRSLLLVNAAVAFKNGVDPRHIRPQLLRAGGSRAELKNSASS
ncbi:MAG: hypothetical protein WA231_03535, partial [Methylocella sp.]